MDRRSHGSTQDGGADTSPETEEAVGFENRAEGVIRVFVVVLGADGDMGRVGLHTSLDKEERGAERRSNTAGHSTGSDGSDKHAFIRIFPDRSVEKSPARFV